MNSPDYCLDTHPLVWYFTGQKTLSGKAKKILDEVFIGKIKCFIPSIVLLEIFHLSLKVKKFNFPQFLKKLQLSSITIVPLDKTILTKCFTLERDLDIHDRIIAATANVSGSVLITKDRTLCKTLSLKTVW